MPITQQRMMSVINAGLDYKEALEIVLDQAKRLQQSVESRKITADEALQHLAAFDPNRLLKFPIESATALLIERKHFQHAQSRNIRMMRQQRVKRGLSPDREGDMSGPNDMLHIRDPRKPSGEQQHSITDRPEPVIAPKPDFVRIMQEHGGKSVQQLKQEIEQMRAAGELPIAEPIRHPEDNEKDWDPEDDLAIDIGEPEAQP